MASGSWYGINSSKQHLDTLLNNKPKLADLFGYPEFMQQLKSHNSKLLDYLSHSTDIIYELIQYLTINPSTFDTQQRKYKLPLMAVEMVESETTCVLNFFFKETRQGGLFIDKLFQLNEQALPVLAGYLFRVNVVLLNCRFKETIERIYKNSNYLQKLISQSESLPMANILQMYLNIDINKGNLQLGDKSSIKVDILNKIIQRIGLQSSNKRFNSVIIIQNLTSILIQTIQKYYLITDGKKMIDILTAQSCIEIMVGMLKQKPQYGYSAISYLISLINYYSFSSFNASENLSAQLMAKNLQLLQSQPIIISLNAYFSIGLQKIMSASSINLYCFRLLQLLCHLISISSQKIFNTMKKVNLFPKLIALLYKHENCNILHMLIEKCFLHIFISDKPIYLDYKKHLFCEIDIIQLTVSRLLDMFSHQKTLKTARNKGYFGHFMRIIKIYSGIQTTDQKIVFAIKSKTEVWNKISQLLIKPYESICYKQLGTFNDIIDSIPLDFKVKKTAESMQRPENAKAIQQIKRQQQIKNIKSLECSSDEGSNSPFKNCEKKADDFFKVPVHGLLEDMQKSRQDGKKSESFVEFMVKKKVEAEKQIQLQRSMSTQKKLSARQKTKLTSPSPHKKNSWRENQDTTSKFQLKNIKVVETQNTHLQQKKFNTASLTERTNYLMSQNIQPTSEPLNFKNIRVIQIDKPTQRKYRKIGSKDKQLLDYLGIAY